MKDEERRVTDETPSVTIALLEPYPGDVALLSQLLAAEGFRVVTPTLDADVLNQVEQAHPDLIIADPFARGWDPELRILQELRRGSQTSGVPLLICTGNSAEVFFRQGTLTVLLKARILPKPFTRQELLTMVRNSLRRPEQ